jgi:hypothetical protein
MEESLIKYISQSNIAIYYDGWRNGKKGAIVDRTGNGKLRFHEQFHTSFGLDDVYEKIEENPIVADGIVASWMKIRQDTTLFDKCLNRNIIFPSSIRDFYTEYTIKRFEEFNLLHRDNPDALNLNLEFEFFTNYIIPHEKKLNKISEALFDYVTPHDCKIIRKIMTSYIMFLTEARDNIQPPSKKPKDNKRRIKNTHDADINKLKNLFNHNFDKKFIPNLKALIDLPRSNKELAYIALLIYNSKHFIKNDYSSFSTWYRYFCKIVKCEVFENYAAPSALKNIPKGLEDLFFFLNLDKIL